MGSSNSRAAELITRSFYDFTVKDIDHKPVECSIYKDKVVLIVNVACSCALTSRNYVQLNQLYAKYNQKGLEILAFPCNQFYNQESGSNEEIKDYVRNDLKAKFPIFNKIMVNGKHADDLFVYLRYKYIKGKRVGWNFGKFLINRKGKIVNYYNPKQDPLSFESEIISLIDENYD